MPSSSRGSSKLSLSIAILRRAALFAHRGRRDVHHRRADELGDEEIGGIEVDLGGRADLLQDALVHHDDAVGERHRLDLVVRHVDRGRAVLEVEALELDAHAFAQLGIERADGLVEEQRLGPADQRAADGDALHVAARERRRPRAAAGGVMPERLADRADHAVDLGLALPDGAQREGDVLVDREVRIERVVLEDEGDVAVGGVEVLHRLAVDQDVAGVDVLEAGDGAQRRGLAAARGAEEDDELLVLHREVDVA